MSRGTAPAGAELRGFSLAPALPAVGCALLAAWLGWHHPLSPPAMLALCALLAALVFLRFRLWPLWLLPCLPLAGLMPWTGWLVVEEWDLLVLAVAVGGYARLAVGGGGDAAARGPVLAAWVAMLAWATLTLIALDRGLEGAGGLQWGWWHGYREPLNSLRLAKPVFEVMLLMPLWHALQPGRPGESARIVTAAMLLLAVTMALPVWWERIAYTGLLNFASDYRATGLFWEMHVGGAALDACLALAAPFVVQALASGGSWRRWMGVALAGALVFYAALATFSRIVYLALPLGLACAWALRRRQPAAASAGGDGLRAGVIVAASAGAAAWLFPVAGYRGLLALLGAVVLLLISRDGVVGLRGGQRLAMAALALAGCAVVAIATLWFPKGAYVAYALFWIVGVAAAAGRPAAARLPVMAGAACLAVCGALAAVAWHWGGAPALQRAAALALSLAAVFVLAASRTPPFSWPTAWRWQAQVAIAAAGVMGAVAALSGSYMEARLTTTQQDSQGRAGHWELMLGLLRSPAQQWLGYGLGRTPAELASSGDPTMRTGDYRWLTEPAGSVLRLTSGSHVQGWGEVFRISQRVSTPAAGPQRLKLRARPHGQLALHVDLCEKHLLYNAACRVARVGLKGDGSEWRDVDIALDGETFQAWRWYAPRLVVLSLSVETEAGKVDLDDVSLIDGQGRELIANGGFEDGLARWFASSDRHHMPWHAKNLGVHLWFEQGLLAVGVFAVIVLAALARLAFGAARRHPLAPPIAGALVGLLVVGAVDSILDMPRTAFLTLWLLAVALSLGHDGPSGAAGPKP